MNADFNDLNEQARADRLAEALDRLLGGDAPGSGDPLLAVAQGLIAMPFTPSADAIARFDQQVNRWFNPPTARPQPRFRPRFPLIAAGLASALVLVAVGVVLGLTVFAPPRATATATPIITLTATLTPSVTHSPTLTTTPSVTPTKTPTLTTTPTASATLTATPTMSDTITGTAPATQIVTATLPSVPIFSQVFISGTIGEIQGEIITIFGQQVQVQGGIGGLCVGDWVSFNATLLPDGTLQVARSAITVVTSGCAITPVPTSAPNPSGSGDDGDDHHKKGDDD